MRSDYGLYVVAIICFIIAGALAAANIPGYTLSDPTGVTVMIIFVLIGIISAAVGYSAKPRAVMPPAQPTPTAPVHEEETTMPTREVSEEISPPPPAPVEPEPVAPTAEEAKPEPQATVEPETSMPATAPTPETETPVTPTVEEKPKPARRRRKKTKTTQQ